MAKKSVKLSAKATGPAAVSLTKEAVEVPRELSIAELRWCCVEVKHGFYPDSARALLEYFFGRIQAGELFSRGTLQEDERVFLDYFGHFLTELVEKKRGSEVALGLKLGRGKYARPQTLERDVSIAAYYVLLCRAGWKPLDAKGEAANHFVGADHGEKIVEAALEKYLIACQVAETKYLQEMLPESTPVIKPR